MSLDVHGVPVLVVGGGPVAGRKAAGLAAAGARVRLVARRIGGAVDRSLLADWSERSFAESDVDGVRLVVTATGHRVTDAAVAATARARGVWVNAADQPADCDFILPAITRAGRVTAAISTDGASPTLAQALRDRVAAQLLTAEVARLAEQLAAERSAVRRAGGSTEGRAWRPRVAAALDRRGGPASREQGPARGRRRRPTT